MSPVADLIAATLSAKQYPSQLYYGSSIFDRRSEQNSGFCSHVPLCVCADADCFVALFVCSVDLDILARNIKFVSEVLCRHIYGYKDKQIDVISSSLGVCYCNLLPSIRQSVSQVNRNYLQAWADFFGNCPYGNTSY